MLAKAAGEEVQSEDSGEDEGDVTKYVSMKEAPVQVIHIIAACFHAQQPQVTETSSKHQAQVTNYRLLVSGQNTQHNIQVFCFNVPSFLIFKWYE